MNESITLPNLCAQDTEKEQILLKVGKVLYVDGILHHTL